MKEVFQVYLEHSDWLVCGIRIGSRIRLYAEDPSGNVEQNKHVTYWSLSLPLGLEFAVHPPSKLTNAIKRVFS